MDRLVKSPVFVFSPPRSGSTLLRCILDSHSKIHAPHEFHLGDLHIRVGTSYAKATLEVFGITINELQELMWDRFLDWELKRSGKEILVEKTPPNVLHWKRISATWPDARYIFLVRNPAHIARSIQEALQTQNVIEKSQFALELAVSASKRETYPKVSLINALPTRTVATFVRAMEEARGALDGPTVRYEDLTAEPEKVVRGLCDFIGVEFEPEMLDYGNFDHGPHTMRVGDWTEKIRTGRIQEAPPKPSEREIPKYLRKYCKIWGY